MPNTNNATVPSEEPIEVSATPETLNTTGSVTDKVTPPASQTDADAVAQLQQKLQKYEQDVRNLKSMSDKRIAEANQTWQKKEEELRRQVEELRLSTLDEEGRAKYLKEVERTRLIDMEDKVTQADRQKADYEASLSAISYYTGLGVPLSDLVLDQGYDALFQSGFKYVTEGYKKAKAQPSTPALPPQAPPVATVNGSTPNLKPTMADLVAKYGSLENVYRGIETGRLDPSIIPIE